jgi:hypothetical protein
MFNGNGMEIARSMEKRSNGKHSFLTAHLKIDFDALRLELALA